MPTKFSAFAVAADFSNADIVVGLQAGDNAQVSKTLFLTASGSEDIGLVGAAGQSVRLDTDSGQASMEMKDDGSILFAGDNVMEFRNSGPPAAISMDSAGRIGLSSAAAGVSIVIQVSGTCGIQFTQSTDTCHFFGQNLNIDWNNTGTPSMWAVASPTFYQDAIDRIAAAVFGLLGGQIP